MINHSGFEDTIQGLQITKDPEAKLVYTLDWSDWLEPGDGLQSADWTVAARSNDPHPIVEEDTGIIDNKTYIELSQGQSGKTYIITTKITTVSGFIDRRSFRVKVEPRVA